MWRASSSVGRLVHISHISLFLRKIWPAAADDETHGTEYTYRVDIYSKRDYIALLRRAKQALKAAGFYGLVIDPEVYEKDTGFYHVPIEAKYYEQTEV